MREFVKSPLNYVGGKHKILVQIFPLFPKGIRTFVDLFAGGANVGINAKADKIILNDSLVYLLDIYQALKSYSIEEVVGYIEETISEFELSFSNAEGYERLRQRYNKEREALDLLVLSFYCFNHQIRFNKEGKFNTPFGRDKSRYNDTIKRNLIRFMRSLRAKEVDLSAGSFEEFNFSELTEGDFVYCDPPYLITDAHYNAGWDERKERSLLNALEGLDERGIKFALSNVLTHKGKTNEILKEWASNGGYRIYDVARDYANCNYHANDKKKNSSWEALICNYDAPRGKTLFDCV
jgi:DNA adenine methylase